jgi:hypothetical protein
MMSGKSAALPDIITIDALRIAPTRGIVASMPKSYRLSFTAAGLPLLGWCGHYGVSSHSW